MNRYLYGAAFGVLAFSFACADDIENVGVSFGPANTLSHFFNQFATPMTQGCSLYKNVLNTVDRRHIHGPTTVSHEEIVTAAVENILNSSGVEGMDGLVIPNAANHHFSSYNDHCIYLSSTVLAIASNTEYNPVELYGFAVSGALSVTRDVYTRYMPPAAYADSMERFRGVFGGLGIDVSMGDDGVVIGAVRPNAPGERYGLEAGDVIVGIEGEEGDILPVQDMSLSDAIGLMRGEVGTQVTLMIQRGDGAPFSKVLTRDIIRTSSTTGQLGIGGEEENKDIAYIQISSFTANTASDFIDSYNELLDQARRESIEIQALVIDVTNNPGGSLNEVIHLADRLTSSLPGDAQPLIATGRNANDNVIYTDAIASAIFTGPIVIIQNERSASASELLAAILKDSGQQVVGTRSFGKYSVQSLFPMEHGAIRVTTSAFFPGSSGLSVQGGLVPNVQVIFNDSRDEWEESARRESDNGPGLLALEQTRAGDIPEYTCSLKSEFSGVLSEHLMAELPSEFVSSFRVYNEELDTFDIVGRFNATLACGVGMLNGAMRDNNSPYVEYAPYVSMNHANATGHEMPVIR